MTVVVRITVPNESLHSAVCVSMCVCVCLWEINQ